MAGSAGETAWLTFAGSSCLADSGMRFQVGGRQGANAVFTLDSDYGEAFNLGYVLPIGYNQGCGEMNLLSGNIEVSNMGVVIASCFGKYGGSRYWYNRTDCAPTGVVRQAGGDFLIRAYGSQTGYGWDDGQPLGLVVGGGISTKTTDKGRVFCGRYELSGGILRAYAGHFLVGAGYSTGEFVQTGGTAAFNDYEYISNHDTDGDGVADTTITPHDIPGAIGLAGGYGRVVVSNGSFYTCADLYVGGANTNIFMQMPIYANGKWSNPTKRFVNYPFDKHDAEGVFSVAGGQVRFARNLVLGADGTGTLEVVGSSAASISVTGSLVLSNSVRSVVRFVLGETSVTPIRVGGTLAISDGAELVVDAGTFTRSKAKLFDCADVAGAFAPGDVSVVGLDNVAGCTVSVEAGGIWFRMPPKGTVLIVK